jgi:hypothetical protein
MGYQLAMLKTLKAVINGDRIQWLEASEQCFPASHSVEALITPLQEQPASPSAEQRAERRLAALKNLVSINAFSAVGDPQSWQRDIREDRELPGRGS